MDDATRSIFLSYRREDSRDVAGRVYDHLALAFGAGCVYKDVDSIPPGVDFREHIATALSSCRVVLVLIGPDWIGASTDHESRIASPADLVRIEVATALRSGKQVIPVLVRGASMPQAGALPEHLRDVTFRNAISVRGDPDFRSDMGKLIQHLRPQLAGLLAAVPRAERLAHVQPAAPSTPQPYAGLAAPPVGPPPGMPLAAKPAAVPVERAVEYPMRAILTAQIAKVAVFACCEAPLAFGLAPWVDRRDQTWWIEWVTGWLAVWTVACAVRVAQLAWRSKDRDPSGPVRASAADWQVERKNVYASANMGAFAPAIIFGFLHAWWIGLILAAATIAVNGTIDRRFGAAA